VREKQHNRTIKSHLRSVQRQQILDHALDCLISDRH